MKAPSLTTARLTLQPPSAKDFPAYRSFYEDAEGSGNYGGPRRADQAWRKLAQDVGHWALRGFGMWTLYRREDGAALGGCGLFHPEGWPSHELTWWLLRGHRGAGYAAEASRAAIAFGYRQLGWPTVETHMRDENLPARRLAERLGGVVVRREIFPDGVERDVFRLPLAEANEEKAIA